MHYTHIYSISHLLISLDGFFDAGMLQQALKANRGEAAEPAERDVIRRNIGRRLRLAEY
jgi:carnitine O-acetyltransferase